MGSIVNWTVSPRPDSDWVKLLLGKTWAKRVQYHEEHHDDDAGPPTSATIMSIHVLTCDRQPKQEGSGTILVPVPGSGSLRQVEVADPWEPERIEGPGPLRSLDGWIVELEIPKR